MAGDIGKKPAANAEYLPHQTQLSQQLPLRRNSEFPVLNPLGHLADREDLVNSVFEAEYAKRPESQATEPQLCCAGRSEAGGGSPTGKS